MTKRKFNAGWYAGSMREAKRAAYMAGVEAMLDQVMKASDANLKAVKREMEKEGGNMSDAIISEIGLIVMTISKDSYKAALRLMAATPFEPPLENQELLETEREPGTADRQSQF